MRGIVFALLFAVVLSLAIPAQAQEVTASITGVVTDASGGTMVGAKVTAKDLDRGTTYPTTTNGSGQYNLPRLPIGQYEVRAEHPGFQAALQPNVLLQLNQVAKIDFTLQVGSVNQTIEVTTAAPILQTESTQLGTIIDARTNEQLPLANRNFVQLTLLSPGAVTTDPNEINSPQSPSAILNGGRPYINGNREQTDNFLVDGMDANQLSENALGYSPSVDAIQEFNLISNNASAEFGNFMGGVISVSLKSGTNTFHGGAFEFLRNNDLNANQWMNNWATPVIPRAPMRWNEFGGDAGGPVIKDKLFFFADYQGSRFDQPATTSSITVLTTQERAGNFSQIGGGTYSACAAGIQSSPTAPCLSPVALAIVNSSLYPTPVNGNLTNNATNTESSPVSSNQGDVKIDWAASEKDHIFGRYSQMLITNPQTNSFALFYNTANSFPSHNGVVDYTRTFGPSLVNELRFGVNYTPVLTGSVTGSGIDPSMIGIADAPATTLPAFFFAGGNMGINTNGIGFGNPAVLQNFADTVIQAEDTLVWTKGTHTMKMGFQAFRERIDTYYSGNAGAVGQFHFSGQYTGSPESDFMTGLPYEVQEGVTGGTWGQRSTIFASFFQDDWKVSRNLTLNLGLRWELHTPWVEVDNRQANFGLFNGQEELPNQNGMNAALYNQYNGITNFEPRIGVAWTPFGGKTVIRASYTLSSFLEGTGTNLRLTMNPPFKATHQLEYAPTETPSTLSDGFAPLTSVDPFTSAELRLWDPNVRPAVSNQWNFSVQHQLSNSMTLQVAYVGQRNTHLMVPILASQLVLNTNGTTSPSLYLAGNPTLQQEIGAAVLTASNGNQDYDALQVSFQKRLANGLEFQANYTWSKCMTNSGGYYGGGGQGAGDYYWQDTYNARPDWGPCYYDTTNAFNGYITYDLPFGRGRAFGKDMNAVENAILGDWQVNTIVNLHGGFPITVQTGIDSSNTGSLSGAIRADCVAPGHVNGTSQPLATGGYQWFDASNSIYAQPANGTFGNCGVGTVRGPGLHTMDLSLSKKFNITERQNLEFRAEAINFTNTPILNMSDWGGNDYLGSTLGQVTQSQGARNIQFGLKYNF